MGAVSLVGYLSFKNGQQAVETLAIQLMTELDSRIAVRLDIYLSEPAKVNALNRAALDLKQVDWQDLKTLKQNFNRQSQIFDQISHIQFGRVDGEFVGLAVNGDGTRTFQVTENSGTLKTFQIQADHSRGLLLKAPEEFDPRDRPWYNTPRKADQPAWTRIYPQVDPPTLAITLGQPYYDPEGRFRGILASTLSLMQISEFLNGLRIGKTGKVLILERSGDMIATSSLQEATARETKTGPASVLAKNSSDPITRQTLLFLESELSNLDAITESSRYRFSINETSYFLSITPLQDRYGLDWLTVVVVPETDFMEQVIANNRVTIVLCSLALMAAVASGLVTARWLTQPILRLNIAAKNITQGNYDQELDLGRNDELGELGDSFNAMTQQLKTTFQDLEASHAALAASKEELAETNHSLEAQVQQRTETLIQSEKLAALGQLTAGIAHEINTPLGAIQASSDNIATALGQSMQNLPLMLQQLSEVQLITFLDLLAVSYEPRDMMSSRETRALKKRWKTLLTEQRVSTPLVLAELLSSMAIPVDWERFSGVLKANHAQLILETADQLSVVHEGTYNIRLAVTRAAKIVFALKSYTHQNHREQLVLASVPETIETVLTLYQNQLKHKVEVTRHYGPLSKIYCYPDALAQVWTNLIHNALQAMDYDGSLKILVVERDRHILVQITDSGSGIPLEIQDKIFEPFFTTKGIGEGSGLGLDIVQKIIHNHQGRIELGSQPGRTTFSLWLSMDLQPEQSVQETQPASVVLGE